MKALKFGLALALAGASFTPELFAGGREPGSVLIYPVQRSGRFITIVSVTNSNTDPALPGTLGGTTDIHYQYLNVIPSLDPFLPYDCVVVDRVERLTPADTLSVLTACHNATGNRQEGYLVVAAQSPGTFKDWSHNYLMGSELVVDARGAVYTLNAIPFASPVAAGGFTDLDGDSQLDFDGMEYEQIPDTLYIDNFIAVANSSLALLNLTGGTGFNAVVQFHIWNDNEFPLSATKTFRCWFDERLTKISPVFENFFLFNNTPNDPNELDLNCDNVGDIETGWVRINGIVANSVVESIPNPALLGSITAGPDDGLATPINGGRLLWESVAKQDNGDFIKYGVDDPEF